MKNNPYVVGLCNAIIPGLGYYLIGERVIFGSLLLAGSLACLLLSFIEPSFVSDGLFISTSMAGKTLESLWYFFFLAAFGYDAWALANEKQATTQPPTTTA